MMADYFPKVKVWTSFVSMNVMDIIVIPYF